MECWRNGVLEKAAWSDAANPLLLITISLYCKVQCTYYSMFATRHYANTPNDEFISALCKLIVQPNDLKKGGQRHESTI